MENQTVWADGTRGAAPSGVPIPPLKKDTEHTRRMKENFSFFGPATIAYAAFYTFCMFKNGSGVTFPFFIAASLWYLSLCLSKLEITLKKGSIFHMASMMLLAVSTFCTGDGRLIAFNKTGIFLLMMSLMIDQFYDTREWKLGKYLGSIFLMVFGCVGWLNRPFSDAGQYFKQKEGKQDSKFWYGLLGVVAAVPLISMVTALLRSADAVFRQVADKLFKGINMGNIFNVLFRAGFLFFASYLLIAFLCEHNLKEEAKDRRKGEPVLAITVTGLLTVIYLLFSAIQIVYLFLGQMRLPEGYTYAEYAREGFFQLLAVSILNLVIVLFVLSFFKESRALKGVLAVMSFCTFIMIASSALRMIIYIQYYYLTFLRILVLWALAVLFLLFVGVVFYIFKGNFPLFRYSMAVVTVLYIALSFCHPDYIIAKINVANAPYSENEYWVRSEDDFFRSDEPYQDYDYLSSLSSDAAPVLIPYLKELGYDLDCFYIEEPDTSAQDYDSGLRGTGSRSLGQIVGHPEMYRDDMEGFGYYYLKSLQEETVHFGIRTYNVSRHLALMEVAEYTEQQADS